MVAPKWNDSDLERFRTELTGYCYRMLGSGFEAEDAVQEAMLRAWRAAGDFDPARGSLRTWLFSIATNICVDMLRGAQRRARAMDLGPAASPGPDLGVPLPDSAWISPMPDGRVLPAHADPAAVAVQRETVRLAFIAALQHLPPRQRAVLILRDVLRWRADEVAALLDTSVAAVTSALQRARSTMSGVHIGPFRPDLDRTQRDLLARYCAAFERYDVAALVALLRSDATMSMPPFPWWLRGRDHIRLALEAAGRPCAGARVLPVWANGSPAVAQYRPDGAGYAGFALVVLDVTDGLISGITTHLAADRLFPLFDLPLHTGPMSFAPPARTNP